ncbi:hypothetical protein LSH36_35g02005 [Paralvinella palmiformis]|uniref:RNA polymerase II subunit A C-terminal domain phosphatase n=1 Tax=Paralvinella palmiformis TaxID=53620 RepID=A0AAD9NE95_9ANNE|nr:hypothetical protein LSH36_35g02005 [Paralvinella palmiformis]
MAYTVTVPGNQSFKITKWKVKKGQKVTQGILLALYQVLGSDKIVKLKCSYVGTVTELLLKEGQEGKPGDIVLTLEECKHPMVMKDMCAECGADLRRLKDTVALDKKGKKQLTSASVAMVHSVPELIVSEEQALELGQQDEQRLLKHRKLVLLVDLDQTLLHTTNDNIPPNLKVIAIYYHHQDVQHFQLWHNRWIWYHTKFRPGTKEFLESISKLYELHICTFGVRMYAHTIASFLDPDKKYFSYRILSRDECFSANSKTANMRALFPCGDSMVCIIDDRDDVWKSAPNLIHVKPYHFFCGTADINAPPGLGKETDDGRSHRHNVNIIRIPKKKLPPNKGPIDGNKVDATSNNGQYEGDKEEPDGSLPLAGKDNNLPQKDSVTDMDTKEIVKEIVNDNADKESEKEDKGSTVSDINDGSKNPTLDNKQDGCQKESNVGTIKGDVDTRTSDIDQILNQDILAQGEPSSGSGSSLAVDSSVEVSATKDSKVSEQVCDDLELSDSSNNESDTETSHTKKDTETTSTITNTQNVTDAKPKEIIDSTQRQKELEENEEDNASLNSSHGNRSTEKEEGEVTSEDDRCENENKKIDTEEYEELIEWEDTDDYLIYLEEILKKIHRVYYEMYDKMKEKKGEELPDLKKIIPYMRSKVLKGVNVLFSGVVPTNQPPDRSHIYHVARSLGANVHSVFMPKDSGEDSSTTHLIAAKLGTSKVNQVKKHKDVHIVNPDWLWSCMERWEWVDERMFPLTDDASYPFADSPDPWKPKKAKPVKEAIQSSSKTNCAASSAIDKEKFADYNPLYAFSSSDIKKMDEEVDEIFDESESEDSEVELRRAVLGCARKRQRESSSSEESLTAEYPKGWGQHQKRTRVACNSSGDCIDDDANIELEEMDDDENEIERKLMEDPSSVIRLSDQSSSDDDDDGESDCNNDSVGSIDDEMAEALEREFLSN